MLIKEIFLPKVLHHNVRWLKKRQTKHHLLQKQHGRAFRRIQREFHSLSWLLSAQPLDCHSPFPLPSKFSFIWMQNGNISEVSRKEKSSPLHLGKAPYALRSATQKPSEFPRVGFTPEEKQNPHTHLKPTLWLLLMGDNFILLGITKLCTIRNSTL